MTCRDSVRLTAFSCDSLLYALSMSKVQENKPVLLQFFIFSASERNKGFSALVS